MGLMVSPQTSHLNNLEQFIEPENERIIYMKYLS
jgi:hypothetical protein